MNNVTKIVGGALAAILVTTTLAMAAGGGQQGNSNRVVQQSDVIVMAIKKATCTVAGSPSEFPDDVWFANKGNVVLKAGTKISYSLAGYGAAKKYTLVADLAPGKDVHALNIIAGGVEAGHDCTAKVL